MMKKMIMGALVMTQCAFANFDQLIETRHSGYAYDQARFVSEEQITKMMVAASRSPSSYNDQPWKFIICDKKLTPQAYDKAFESLVEPNQKWVKDVPLLIVVLTDTVSGTTKEFNRFAEYDAGAAAMSLVYQATEMGLMAHQMGGYHMDKLTEAFSIPKQYTPMAIIAVGYEKSDAVVKPKGRKPLQEIFFDQQL